MFSYRADDGEVDSAGGSDRGNCVRMRYAKCENVNGLSNLGAYGNGENVFVIQVRGKCFSGNFNGVILKTVYNC